MLFVLPLLTNFNRMVSIAIGCRSLLLVFLLLLIRPAISLSNDCFDTFQEGVGLERGFLTRSKIDYVLLAGLIFQFNEPFASRFTFSFLRRCHAIKFLYYLVSVAILWVLPLASIE